MRKPNVTKEECVNILLQLYKNYGRLTIPLIEEYSGFTRRSLRTHFGSLENFMQLYNLVNLNKLTTSTKGRNRNRWTKEDCIKEANRIVNKYGYFSKGLLEKYGKINHKAYILKWGTFKNFVLEYNLPTRSKIINYTNQELLESLNKLNNINPNFTTEDINRNCIASVVTYIKRFGSIIEACKQANIIYNPNSKSKSETKWLLFIEQILNIKIDRQKQFSWLLGKSNHPYRLDGYSKEYNLAIEYNGLQHYKFNKRFYKSLSDFEHRKNIDLHKYQLLQKHNIKLLIIKYDDTEEVVHQNLSHILGLST